MKENLKDSAGNIIEWPEKLHFDNCDIFTEDDEMIADGMSDSYIDGEGHNMLYRELVRRWNSHDKLLEACKSFLNGWLHFCDHVDFGKSNLDAESIRFMNEVPGKIETAYKAAIAAAEAETALS